MFWRLLWSEPPKDLSSLFSLSGFLDFSFGFSGLPSSPLSGFFRSYNRKSKHTLRTESWTQFRAYSFNYCTHTFIFGSSLAWSLSFSGSFSSFFIFSASLRFLLSSSLHLRRSSSRRRLRSSSLLLRSSFFSSLSLWRTLKQNVWGQPSAMYTHLNLNLFTCLFFRKSSRGVVFLAWTKEMMKIIRSAVRLFENYQYLTAKHTNEFLWFSLNLLQQDLRCRR